MARTDNKDNEREVTNVNMTKISAVMRPAQKDATARLLKNAANGGDKLTGGEMPDKIDYAAEAKTLAEGMVKELGIEDKIDVLSASIQTALEKQSESHDKALADVGEKMADLEKMAGMSDYERVYMDKMDGDAKKAFMSLSPDERKKKMDAMKKSDESIEYEGQTLIKSQTDPAMYAMVKSMVKKNEDLEKAQKESLAKQVELELKKEASDNYPNVPGATWKLLKAAASMDEESANLVKANLKAQNEYLGKAKTELGTNETGDTSGKWDALVKSKMAEAGNDLTKAMELAAATPEGEALYNEM